MTHARIRAWIVDDEPLARERIRSLLETDPEIVIAGESPDGRHAARALASERPDLVFLDVQMPELDGFAVLQSLPADAWPAVIFVTAYDAHAVRAFEVHAIDYLLKPFDRERFEDALAHAKQRLHTPTTTVPDAILRDEAASNTKTRSRAEKTDRARPMTSASGDFAAATFGHRATPSDQGIPIVGLEKRIRELIAELRGDSARRIAVNEDGKLTLIRPEEIDWIEAAGNYVKLHLGSRTHLHREPLKDFEKKLDPDRFLRIHRSIVVNLDRIRTLEPWFHGGWLLVLTDGTELHSSRTAAENLRARFGR